MTFIPLMPYIVEKAYQRIASHLHHTPLLVSSLLNNRLGHEVLFKAEGLQKTGSFKCRGAINALLELEEQGKLPKHIAAFSSGNHAQGVAWAGQKLGIKTTIFLPEFTSKIKQQATRSYGAEVILTPTRQLAEENARKLEAEGAYLLPPFDDDGVIAGQGTVAYEVFNEGITPDAIFATCGGGGLLSGTFLATQLLSPQTLVYGAEPLLANDATQSYNSGTIVRFDNPPPTLADGARTLAVAERTFHYLQQIAGFYEVEEQNMLYWTQWLTHLLKTPVEPTSALGMAAAAAWLEKQTSRKTVVVILSGGNIAPEAQQKIWEVDYLVG